MQASAKCAECGRVFDLTNRQHAIEWEMGHDCETDEEIYVPWEFTRSLFRN